MNRYLHARRCGVHNHVSIFEVNDSMHQRLRMNQHLDFLEIKAEKYGGFYHFKSLVHESGRVNGNFLAHIRPSRMFQNLIKFYICKFISRFTEKWPAGSGKDYFFNILVN